MKLKFKHLFCLLLLLLAVTVITCGCNKPEDNDDDTPGDEYSGSLSGGGSTPDPETPKDEGDQNTTYEINNADDLMNMKRKGKYVLKADIDMTGKEWTPVGTHEAPFIGSFDGNGYKITGLSVSKSAEDVGASIGFKYSYCGLFGYATEATIKNVTIDATVNVNETAQNRNIYAGVLGGYFKKCSITDVTVSGSVSVVSSNYSAYAGGLVGGITETTVNGCSSSASVKTDRSPVYAYSGGLFAESKGNSKVSSSCATGNVYASSTVGLSYAGGLFGYCFTTEVTNCYSASKVYSEVSSSAMEEGKKGAAYSGGLAAIASSIPLEGENEDDDPINTCVFLRSYYIGSEVAADGGDNSSYSGGLAAKSDYASFRHCYSKTSIKAESDTEEASAAGISTVATIYTRIDGCFYVGDMTVNARTNALATVGTIVEQSTEEALTNITSTAYSSSNSCIINGKTYKCVTENKEKIKLNGVSKSLSTFSDITSLAEVLGWNVSEWTMDNSLPVPVN